MAWQRALVLTHRWLGIAGGLLFIAWFASGIVMIYARMPAVSASERRAARAPLDFSAARVAPADVLRDLPDQPAALRLAMLAGRPVYRAVAGGRITTVFADTGKPLAALTAAQALDAAAVFLHRAAATLCYDRRLADADQWTLESAALLPMHRVLADDADDTVVYVSDRTGEVEMKTTARERRLAYAGPVIHWLYFTPLRRRGAVWGQLIIWLSIAGCVMCLSGLAWGITVARRSPYAGLMRWHHYAGLIFGATTCTWIFSGLLSMDPWDWHPPTTPTVEQREAVAGGPLRLDALTIDALQRSLAALASGRPVTEAEIVQFQGSLLLSAAETLVRAMHPERGAIDLFDDPPLLEAARRAMPDAAIADAARLTGYDAYYYDRDGSLPLPVLRVRFTDPQRTWLYLDPRRGTIAHRETRLSRANRWLYHGLHSLDFPFLYRRRPLWDAVMIVLSVGGLTSAVTSLVPGWRRLRRHLRRVGPMGP